MTPEQQTKRDAAERDGWPNTMCQWPGCGERAVDTAHILPKGRYPKQRADIKNLVSLCREHHAGSENRADRVMLLQVMARLHRYDYSVYPYCEYWEDENNLSEYLI